ncbi:MAG TPA: sialate O-acetylesterase [Candidatus Blautia faecavium]|uniref:Sialate O-acetylesterase n=1 Tax=Candidatus Blautia faecavium TaxID=2838487 RepID=A0A9D2LQL1_9FIRM|nr:sialate O-acetylesterase [Candidatus Blautia faecavium]
MDFTVSEMFGDYMVLQRDKPVKIWGTAEPGSSIKVRVQNTYAQTQTDLKKGEEEYFKNTHFDPSKPFQNPVDVQIMKGLPLEQLLEIYKKQGEEEPVQYVGPWHQYRPCGIYHTMLRQAAPYTLKGFLYYQGESDETHPEIYGDMLKGLIECWRRDWEENLPFLMVQLAPLGEAVPNGGKYFPELRRQQEKAAKETEKVYVASIGDVGSSYDIHPKEKRPVGVRLALLARGNVYGQKILCEAPVPGKCEMEGRELGITFQNTEGGLLLKGEKINALKILEENGEEVKNWEFSIAENTLYIKLPCEIKSPFFISFAQTPYYEVNLYNQADIPVKPFKLAF